MDYKEKYEAALDAARDIYKRLDSEFNRGQMEDLEVIFPELAESEDERIRKELIRLLSKMTDGIVENYTPIPLRDFIAYLEKQNLQQSAEWSEEDEKTIDGVEYWLNRRCFGDYSGHCELSAQEVLDRLKSLRPQPKMEWSEEDNEALNMCVDAIPKAWKTKSGKLLTDWFLARITYIKLNNWKPSEGQMDALRMQCDALDKAWKDPDRRVSLKIDVLKTLYDDLKKLM